MAKKITLEQYTEAQKIIRAYRLQKKQEDEAMSNVAVELMRDKISKYGVEEKLCRIMTSRLFNLLFIYRSKRMNYDANESIDILEVIKNVSIKEFREIHNCGEKTVTELIVLLKALDITPKP